MIKKGDTVNTEYTLNLSDLYDLCGLKSDSYTEMKIIIKALSDKSWWLPINNPDEPWKESESLVRWFNTLVADRQSQKVRIKFHEHMTPHIFALYEKYEQYGSHYAGLLMKYSLPMKKMYSPRLYELLLSYSVNNKEWWFEVDKLKNLLNCVKYKAWKDFRTRALDPAIEEINKYTDINVYYEITGKTGKRIDEITFYMTEKTQSERIQAEKDGLSRLEPGLNYWDNQIEGQMNLMDEVDEQ